VDNGCHPVEKPAEPVYRSGDSAVDKHTITQ
jgi:hypothetical protein